MLELLTVFDVLTVFMEHHFANVEFARFVDVEC